MAVFKVYEHDFEFVKKELAKIIRKCEKYGSPYEFKVVKEDVEEYKKLNGTVGCVKTYYIQVEGVAKIHNWEFIAVMTATEKGNVFRNFNSRQVPKDFYYKDKHCDHCNTRRYRKNTYIIRNINTKEVKQVGSTCLNDYIGENSLEYAMQCLKLLDFLHDVSTKEFTPPSKDSVFKTLDVLMFGLKYITKNVYGSSENYEGRGSLQEARELQEKVEKEYATRKRRINKPWPYTYRDAGFYKQNVLVEADLYSKDSRYFMIPNNLIYSYKDSSKRFINMFNDNGAVVLNSINDVDLETIKQILLYIRVLPEGNSNYRHSIKVLCKRTYIEESLVSLLLTVFPFYFYMKNKDELENVKKQRTSELRDIPKEISVYLKEMQEKEDLEFKKRVELKEKEQAEIQRAAENERLNRVLRLHPDKNEVSNMCTLYTKFMSDKGLQYGKYAVRVVNIETITDKVGTNYIYKITDVLNNNFIVECFEGLNVDLINCDFYGNLILQVEVVSDFDNTSLDIIENKGMGNIPKVRVLNIIDPLGLLVNWKGKYGIQQAAKISRFVGHEQEVLDITVGVITNKTNFMPKFKGGADTVRTLIDTEGNIYSWFYNSNDIAEELQNINLDDDSACVLNLKVKILKHSASKFHKGKTNTIEVLEYKGKTNLEHILKAAI